MAASVRCSAAEFYDVGKLLLEQGVSVRLRVFGQSMVPFVRDGEIIEVAPLAGADLRPGDIVLYRSGRRLLVHRVIEINAAGEGAWFVTRGDSLCEPDLWAAQPDLLGRVRAVIRQEKRIALDTGLAGLAGLLLARCRLVHRLVLRTSRIWRRLQKGREYAQCTQLP